VCALSAIAVSKGYGGEASAVRELTPDTANELLEWFYSG
jgi:hypothetical protein